MNFYDVAEASLPMSMRALRQELKLRGWQVQKLYNGAANNLILTRPDGKELRIASSTPPTTSVFALKTADDKLSTYSLLQTIRAPQPLTVLVKTADDAAGMLQEYGTIVIKPADGAHGRGVTTGITTLEQVPAAIEKAELGSLNQHLAIAQPQMVTEGPELRVICIDYKFVLAVARIPAKVTGDGVHTVAELIELENTNLRAAPYTSRLAWIDLKAAADYLGERMTTIPAVDEKVRVSATSNVGQGGTAEDYSDKITAEQKLLAEQIARTMELPVIGVDLMAGQVLEVNACPSLYYPIGTDADTKCIKAYVDYLEKL